MADRPTCSTCQFLDLTNKAGGTGLCRINPPSLTSPAKWPTVMVIDWCGHHSPPKSSTIPSTASTPDPTQTSASDAGKSV